MTHWLLMHAPEIGTALFVCCLCTIGVLLLDLIVND